MQAVPWHCPPQHACQASATRMLGVSRLPPDAVGLIQPPPVRVLTARSDDVRATIEKASDLAPLHNPPNLMGIDAAKTTFASAPHVRGVGGGRCGLLGGAGSDRLCTRAHAPVPQTAPHLAPCAFNPTHRRLCLTPPSTSHMPSTCPQTCAPPAHPLCRSPCLTPPSTRPCPPRPSCTPCRTSCTWSAPSAGEASWLLQPCSPRLHCGAPLFQLYAVPPSAGQPGHKRCCGRCRAAALRCCAGRAADSPMPPPAVYELSAATASTAPAVVAQRCHAAGTHCWLLPLVTTPAHWSHCRPRSYGFHGTSYKYLTQRVGAPF